MKNILALILASAWLAGAQTTFNGGHIIGNGLSISGDTLTSASATSTNTQASGTPYTLTATAAQITFGTTSPAVTLTQAGTYLLLSRANTKYSGATFAGNQTVSIKLRKTSGTPADLTGIFTTNTLRIITLLTDSAGTLVNPPAVYTAAANDVIRLWGNVSTLPSAGSVLVTEAEIVAVRLY